MSNSLQPHGLQPARLLCPSLSPRACSDSCPLSRWCHLTISSSAAPFSSCLQSFPASGFFPINWLFASGGQSVGASTSTSVLRVNIQGWFPFRLTSVISLLSKGFSRAFKSINLSLLGLLYGQILTSIHDYWKDYSFDHTDLCQQSDVFVLIRKLKSILMNFYIYNIFKTLFSPPIRKMKLEINFLSCSFIMNL